MPFVINKEEDFSYSSPQKMYQDNKLKKIMGPLDYQSEMLDAYMSKYSCRNIALELPTGCGKTFLQIITACSITGVIFTRIFQQKAPIS